MIHGVRLGYMQARIVRGERPADLFRQIDWASERLLTYPEILQARVRAIGGIEKQLEGHTGIDGLHMPPFRELAGQKPGIWAIWSERFTGNSHMVRATDARGSDTMFFFHGNPFPDIDRMIAALEGSLSDGGFRYSDEALAKIRVSTPESSQMPYSRYQKLRGGKYLIAEFQEHPAFKMAAGDNRLHGKYAACFTFLDNLFGFYCHGMQSGWLPGNMEPGFGRLIAAGWKGDAFYPPNNSTLGHAALAVPQTLDKL